MTESKKPSKKRSIVILAIILALMAVAILILVKKCPVPIPAGSPATEQPTVEAQKEEAPPMDVGKAPLDISKPDLGRKLD